MKSSSVAAIKRHRTAQLAKLVTRSYYLHRRGQDDKMANLICEEFVSLGGVYIKFLQGVMLQSFIMKRWQNPDKLKIFENLETEPLDVMAILRYELSPEKLAQIAMVQPQPFAAGSFGQVYYGLHVNGKPIIIKVLRPMIGELLKYDLRLLTAFSRRFFIKLYKNASVQLDEAVKDFRNATLRETDYRHEAEFAAELYAIYHDHPKFVVPQTYLDLCTDYVIVQDYVEGVSVAQLVNLYHQGVDPKEYVRETLGSDLDQQLITLGIEAIKGIFNLSRIQGDPHPGNVRLLSDNRVGLIDFGISAKTPVNKAAFFGLLDEWGHLYDESDEIVNLFEQFIRFFVSDLYRALKRLSKLMAKDDADFTKEVGKVAQDAFRKVVGTADIKPIIMDGRLLQIVNQMINKGNRFGLIMKLEASEILRAAQTYITLVDALGRRNTVLPIVIQSVIKEVDLEHPEIRHQQDEGVSISDALEIVSSWLERVAQRDPDLFRQLTNRINMGASKSEPKVEPKLATAGATKQGEPDA